jgi:hypothetical protein
LNSRPCYDRGCYLLQVAAVFCLTPDLKDG